MASTTTRTATLDLFVANYVQWTRSRGPLLLARRVDEVVLHAGVVQGDRVEAVSAISAAGSSQDVSAKAGVADPTSKSLGIAVLDYDGDGWPDLFVANDTQPNKLYRNNRNGTFTEEGVSGGRRLQRGRRCARRDGRRRGATTIARAARTCSWATSRTRCSASTTTRARSSSWTRRRAPRSGARACCSTAFGVFFFDYDLDGHLDIFAANGHIEEAIGERSAEGAVPSSRRCCSGIPARASSSTRAARSDPRSSVPQVGARRGLRRLRQGRRPRRAVHQQPRPGAAVQQRRRQRAQLDLRSKRWGRSRTASGSAPSSA